MVVSIGTIMVHGDLNSILFKEVHSSQVSLIYTGADQRGVLTPRTPPPPPFWGTTKLHKEGKKNVERVRTKTPLGKISWREEIVPSLYV